MNAITTFNHVEDEPFFPPVDHDRIEELLRQYAVKKEHVEEVSALMTSARRLDVMGYFLDGNCRDNSKTYSLNNAQRLFDLEGALRALDARFWDQAFSAIKIWDDMPEKRRGEWREKIRNNDTAPFEGETVRTVIAGLDAARAQFLAERVDGIFRALSYEHVTNSPQGFFKRMILAYCYDGLSYNSPYPNSKYAGHINDLRAVIATFMGRDQPHWNATSNLLRIAYTRPGDWMTVDGGALRLRAYKKGTVHIEINPDFAYRLNRILAALHPFAIPSEFRTKPKVKPKEFVMTGRPLPFAVIEMINSMHGYKDAPNFHVFSRNAEENKAVYKEACQVLEMLGGVPSVHGKGLNGWQFDYDITAVMEEIITTGCIPDQRSHQFYPTPEEVGEEAVSIAMAGANDAMTWLEPSAGLGGLAQFMPQDRTVCIEISPLHCKVLEAKGFKVLNKDFLTCETGKGFDRVLMNPPFSEGRWKAHVEHAATMLKPGGRLVAILPASARNKDWLVGFDMMWSSAIENKFDGTSIAVTILTADKRK